MLLRTRFYFYFFFVLAGFLPSLQNTDGNRATSSSARIAEGKANFWYQRLRYPRDCKEVLDQCPNKNVSGVFVIKPEGYPYPFEVYCNNSVDSGGWTVLLRRFDGSLVFSRNWHKYKGGFGFLSSEFWLGNDKLSSLTNQKQYELRIDMTISNGSKAFLTYSYFRIKDELGNYTLTILGEAKGNTDFLAPICPNNMIYSTCTCEKTCGAPTICQNNCQVPKRCFCPDGFFLRGTDCVRPEDCECYLQSLAKVVPIGEAYLTNQCSEKCACNEGRLTCSDYSGCNQNAMCTTTSESEQCTCNRGYVGDGTDCTCDIGYKVDGSRCRRPRDCDEVPSVRGYSGSGLYYILPNDWQEFQVYCNMSEGRWTVLQRRIPGSGRTFFLGWNSYKMGFGDLEEDLWLGNDKIHHLTNQGNYELRIDIIDNGNRHYIAQYDRFRIGNEDSKYTMTHLGTYSGNAGSDALRGHLNQPFTTRDQDNDDWDGSSCYYRYLNDSCVNHRDPLSHNCAFLHEGAWWYKNRGAASRGGCDHSASYSSCNNHQCHRRTCCEDSSCNTCGTYSYTCIFSNLNGPQRGPKGKSIIWRGLSGNDCGIKFTEMKIRPI